MKRVPFKQLDDNLYGQNIQIAELNAINACLAIVRWKKRLGIYKPENNEIFHSIYDVAANKIYNESL